MGDRTESFIAAMDAIEEYMRLQQALADALRAGFLSLAQARYSMGSDRVSSLQYPSHMTATARVAAGPDGKLSVVSVEPGASSSPPSGSSAGGSTSTAALPSAAAAAPVAASSEGTSSSAAALEQLDKCTEAAADAAGCETPAITACPEPENRLDSVDEELQRLRLAAQQNDSILELLAAKYGCSDASPTHSPGDQLRDDGRRPGVVAAADDEEYAEVAKPGRPLHWFGSLVAPSLRNAEKQFASALDLAVQAANAQRRLRLATNAYRTAAAQKEAQPPAAAPPHKGVAIS